MTFDKRGNRNVSSRDYAYAKELIHSTIVSIETREKQSNARKGKNTWMKDKKHTDESIEKIREARKKQKPWNKDTKGLFFTKENIKRSKSFSSIKG
jgi:UDP-N-acetylenolpyruvoylglucosamine reductase